MGDDTRHHTTTTTSNPRRRGSLLAGALIGALALAACSGVESDSDDASAQSSEIVQADFDVADSDDVAVQRAETSEAPAAESPGDAVAAGDSPGFDLGSIGRDVIIEMHVLMSSDDIQRSVASITATANTLGGGIASSNVSFGDPDDPEQRGHAVLVVKVPPDAVDRLLSGLDTTGEVRSIEQTSQDVTEQLVDLDVRIDNARESVANVRGFMEQTDNLTDLVTLESELTRRQTELERLAAQKGNLSDRVALSTVTVEIVPTPSLPVEEIEEENTIADGFRTGWDVLTGMLFLIVYAAAVLLPFLVIAAVLGTTLLLVTRRRTRPRSPLAEPPTPAHAPDVEDETVSA